MHYISIYFPLIAVLILFLAAIIMVFLRISRQKISIFWFSAATASLIAWTLILLSRMIIPFDIVMGTWKPVEYFSSSPVLLVDGFSWPYAMGLATIILAVILSDAARIVEVEWSTLAGSLMLGGLGLIAVLSGNQLTLLLAWAALDMFEMILWMVHVHDSSVRERIIISFSLRLFGIMLSLLGGGSSVVYIIAVALRLAVLSIHLPMSDSINLRRGLGSLLRLLPAVSALVFTARIALLGVPPGVGTIFLVSCLVTAGLASWQWLIARDELDGRPFWVLGMSAIALASAIRGQPFASLSWGMNMMLVGGLVFLFSARNKWLLFLVGLGFFGSLTLPFTPSRDAAALYSPPLPYWMLLFVIPQALLMIGYLRHALRAGENLLSQDRLAWVLYPFGLFLLPLIQYLIGYWNWRDMIEVEVIASQPQETGTVELITGMVVLVMVLLGVVIIQKKWLNRFSRVVKQTTQASNGWFFRLANGIYRSVGSVINLFTTIMEGDAGLLWMFLLLTLLLVFFAQGGSGG